eukprot:8189946-Lingulodinium_polyedra.AAC.1
MVHKVQGGQHGDLEEPGCPGPDLHEKTDCALRFAPVSPIGVKISHPFGCTPALPGRRRAPAFPGRTP